MRLILSGCLILTSFSLIAQWQGTNPVYFNAGNVGIGTSTPGVWFGSRTFEFLDTRPVFKLTSTQTNGLSTIVFTNSGINGTSHSGEFHMNHYFNATATEKSTIIFGGYPGGNVFTMQADGNVAIQDDRKFSLRGINSGDTGIEFHSATETVRISHTRDNYNRYISLGGYTSGSWYPQLTVNTNDGNVGIGTTIPDSKLTVKGAIHTNEVKVDLLGSVAPDYVFEKDYPLTSLSELKSYIDQNKHLPEIPSAKEMEQEGINLKEMNLLLLKKVEELTLYLIDQKEINDKQQALIEKQGEELNTLKDKLHN